MRVVALVSGGKDSCYNMMQCITAGHDIVALAHLTPYNKDELDSYMYQSVGHEGVALMGEAMGLPLYQQETSGQAKHLSKDYVPTSDDEVEDLFQLLQRIQADMTIEGVAVGAILSDYQRVRVENVCTRLGLVSLAYLWQRDQSELLQEMIDCHVKAVLVKVATLGLDPTKHLGKTIAQLQPHLLNMKDKYGLNVCGEGGEYETFTLDCPLYTSAIIIDDSDLVLHSDNAIAPVGYLRLKSLRLIPKSNVNESLKQRLSTLTIKDSDGYITDPGEEAIEDLEDCGCSNENNEEEDDDDKLCYKFKHKYTESMTLVMCETSSTGWTWCGSVIGSGGSVEDGMEMVLNKLLNALKSVDLSITDVCSVNMFIADMSAYPIINKLYCAAFSHINPPTRACVQVPLPDECHVIMEVLAWKQKHHTDSNCGSNTNVVHVQGISHWAPANIGPYSQAIRADDIICVAGQIGLVPGNMKLVTGGIRQQCQLALRHVGRIVTAAGHTTHLRDVVQGVCYVTKAKYIEYARKEWEERTNNAIVDYVVVSRLPRDALVEWHVWAHMHNNQFGYEETGKCVNDYSITIRRRWNYENNVSAIVCHICRTYPIEDSVFLLPICVLEEMLDYILTKLNQTDAEDVLGVSYLRLFYPVTLDMDVTKILSALQEISNQYKVVYTLVPVCALQDSSVMLSVCGIRND